MRLLPIPTSVVAIIFMVQSTSLRCLGFDGCFALSENQLLFTLQYGIPSLKALEVQALGSWTNYLSGTT